VGKAAVKEKLREEAEYCRSVKPKIVILTRPNSTKAQFCVHDRIS